MTMCVCHCVRIPLDRFSAVEVGRGNVRWERICAGGRVIFSQSGGSSGLLLDARGERLECSLHILWDAGLRFAEIFDGRD